MINNRLKKRLFFLKALKKRQFGIEIFGLGLGRIYLLKTRFEEVAAETGIGFLLSCL